MRVKSYIRWNKMHGCRCRVCKNHSDLRSSNLRRHLSLPRYRFCADLFHLPNCSRSSLVIGTWTKSSFNNFSIFEALNSGNYGNYVSRFQLNNVFKMSVTFSSEAFLAAGGVHGVSQRYLRPFCQRGEVQISNRVLFNCFVLTFDCVMFWHMAEHSLGPSSQPRIK